MAGAVVEAAVDHVTERTGSATSGAAGAGNAGDHRGTAARGPRSGRNGVDHARRNGAPDPKRGAAALEIDGKLVRGIELKNWLSANM